MSHYEQDEQNIIINFYNGKTNQRYHEDIQKGVYVMKTYDLIVIGFGKAGKTLGDTPSSTGQHVRSYQTDQSCKVYQYRMYTFEDTCT